MTHFLELTPGQRRKLGVSQNYQTQIKSLALLRVAVVSFAAGCMFSTTVFILYALLTK